MSSFTNNGYWFSTEDGTHIFAKYGQSKADAIMEFREHHENYYIQGNTIRRYNSVKDMMDSKIFHYYFSRLSLNKKTFSKDEKIYFVSVLKSIYDNIDSDALNHYLIPDSADYLEDSLITTCNSGSRIALNYKWPPNQGFLGTPTQILLPKGYVFDRYGGPQGVFVSPIINGIPFTIAERALPYYIPQNKRKALYHKYEVIEDFSQIKSSIESYYDPTLSDAENRLEREILLKEYNDFSLKIGEYTQNPGYANIGEVASAFNGGGGIQIELPMRIKTLLNLKIIKEVK